jgi:hypothetical protein
MAVAFTLTVPGQSSSGPRRQLRAALGERARIEVVATDRRRDCITLRIETAGQSFDDTIRALTATLREATLGPATVRLR